MVDFDFEIDGLAVRFFNRTVFNANTWSWDFGDMSSSTIREPRHTYSGAGNYMVTLIAVCGAKESSITKILKVNAGPPTPALYQLDTTGLTTAAIIPDAAANQRFVPFGILALTNLNIWVLNDSSLPLLVQSYGVAVDFSVGDTLDFTSFMLASLVANLAGTSRTVFFSLTLTGSSGNYELPLLPSADFAVGSGTPVTVTNGVSPSNIDLITTTPSSTVEIADCPGVSIPDYIDASVSFTLDSGLPSIS